MVWCHNKGEIWLIILHGLQVLCDKRGISHEVQEEYWQRFQHAFATEAQEFIDSVLQDSPVPLPLSLGVKVMQIARALQSALWTGEVSRFDEQGKLVSTGESKTNGKMNGHTNGVTNGSTNAVMNGHLR